MNPVATFTKLHTIDTSHSLAHKSSCERRVYVCGVRGVKNQNKNNRQNHSEAFKHCFHIKFVPKTNGKWSVKVQFMVMCWFWWCMRTRIKWRTRTHRCDHSAFIRLYVRRQRATTGLMSNDSRSCPRASQKSSLKWRSAVTTQQHQQHQQHLPKKKERKKEIRRYKQRSALKCTIKIYLYAMLLRSQHNMMLSG